MSDSEFIVCPRCGVDVGEDDNEVKFSMVNSLIRICIDCSKMESVSVFAGAKLISEDKWPVGSNVNKDTNMFIDGVRDYLKARRK